ncbi:MAG TPA: hypothetical protein VJU16_01780 [Planctomycetota bacterium]|nr:hypothetical protein [Planctomycetota bacterium]
MKRAGLVMAIVAVTAVGGAAMLLPPPPRADAEFTDVSGLWRMRETHKDFEGILRWTWLEIRQDGDRLEIRAWEEQDNWTCVGKGRVEGRKALFQWWGADKSWRGTASLELRGGELMGIFQRLDVHAGEQYCRGSRAAGARSGAFDISQSRP